MHSLYHFRKLLLILTACVASSSVNAQVYDVEWLDLVGAAASDGNKTITKNVADAWNNSGAMSRYYLDSNTDGWIEYTVNATNERKAVGFSDYNQTNHYFSIDYALYFGGDGKVYAALSGTFMANVTVAVGDVLRLERTGSDMIFQKNGTTFYTATSAMTFALIPDAAIYTNGATFSNLTASFGRKIGRAHV